MLFRLTVQVQLHNRTYKYYPYCSCTWTPPAPRRLPALLRRLSTPPNPTPHPLKRDALGLPFALLKHPSDYTLRNFNLAIDQCKITRNGEDLVELCAMLGQLPPNQVDLYLLERLLRVGAQLKVAPSTLHLLELFLDDRGRLLEGNSSFRRGGVYFWEQLIRFYLHHHQTPKALKYLQETTKYPSWVIRKPIFYFHLLRILLSQKEHSQVSFIHSLLLQQGIPLTTPLCSLMMTMYSRCNQLKDCEKVLEYMVQHEINRNEVIWNIMINGYVQSGQWEKAFEVFEEMARSGVKPDGYTWNVLLKGYLKGTKEKTWVFRKMMEMGYSPDVVTWTTLLNSLLDGGDTEHADEIFKEMLSHGIKPNIRTWNTFLKGQSKNKDPLKSMEVIERMRKEGTEPDLVTWNTLIHAYTLSHQTKEAEFILNMMKEARIHPDEVTWTTFIKGYVNEKNLQEAVRVLVRAKEGGLPPSDAIYLLLIKGCTAERAVKEGNTLHGLLKAQNYNRSLVLVNALINMYAKHGHTHRFCGLLGDVLELGLEADVLTWTSLIDGFGRRGKTGMVHKLFRLMKNSKVPPDDITHQVIISALRKAGHHKQALIFSQRNVKM